MLFELAGSAALLKAGGSTETTTGSEAEVDAELWLVRACFKGGSDKSELRERCGESMSTWIVPRRSMSCSRDPVLGSHEEAEDFIGQGRVFHSY